MLNSATAMEIGREPARVRIMATLDTIYRSIRPFEIDLNDQNASPIRRIWVLRD